MNPILRRWTGLVRRLAVAGAAVVIANATANASAAPAAGAAAPGFKAAPDGGFAFDTGVLRGRLRLGGKALGLQEVVHVPTGRRLDRSNGLLSHYRVFTAGQRHGEGAWSWPGTARLRDDGAVEVQWPAAEGRSFTLGAVYRWRDAQTVEVETTVGATADLRGFEVFLASYFDERFTNALVAAGAPGGAPAAAFVRATADAGEWQVFPRDDAALALVADGRWKLPPNPVEWTVRPRFHRPLVRRRSPASGLNGILMAPAEECFALALPQEQEGHYSVYLSLFGRDVPAGTSARARARLTVAAAKSDAAVLALYEQAVGEWRGGAPAAAP